MTTSIGLTPSLIGQQERTWDFESAKQAELKKQIFNKWGTVSQVIGVVGALISGYKVGLVVFSAAVLSPGIVVCGITSIALFCLGIFLKHLAKREVKELTDAQLYTLNFEKLKQKLSSFSTQEWETAPADSQVTKSFDELKGLDPAVQVNYWPAPGNQPYLIISSEKISLGQKLDLLDIAYHKGVILEFTDHHYIPGPRAKIDPTVTEFVIAGYSHNREGLREPRVELPYSQEEWNKKPDEKAMKKSFLCNLGFLERRLKELNRDVARINAQLTSLCFKFRSENEQVLKPAMLLENDQTLAVQDNCYKYVHIPTILQTLSSYVQTMKIEINSTNSFGYQQNLHAYKDKLMQNYPHKLVFTEKPEMKADIWQENPYQYGLKEIIREGKKELQRVMQRNPSP